MDNKLRTILSLVFLFCFVFYLIMVSFHMKKPFMFDEVQYSKAAEMIADTGRPVIYYWSQGNKPWIIIMAHTTLYINLLAFAYKLFSKTEFTGYLFGAVNALLNLAILILIIKFLFKERKKYFIVSLIAVCLYLINPLLIRGSIVIDIDNTVLMSSILLFILLFIKSQLRPQKNDLWYLSLVFALCIWAKEISLALLIPAVFLYLLLSEQRRKASIWIKWFLIFFLGFFIFVITWMLYCKFLNLPFIFPVEYTILGRTKAFLFSGLYSRLATFRNAIFWLSPFLAILTLLAIFVRINIFLKLKKIEPIDFVAILGILIFFFYTVIMPTTVVPKYFVLLVPIFSILCAPFIYENLIHLNKKFLFWSVIITFLFFIFYFKLIPDPLLILLNKQISNNSFWLSLLNNKVSMMLIYIFPLFFLITVLTKFSKYSFLPKIAVSTFLLYLSSSVSVSTVQATSDYATFYHYGERGLKQTIGYLKNNIDTKAVIFGRKEFEYYLPHKVYFDRTGMTSILQELLDNKKISYVVFSDYYEGDKTIADKLEKTYKRIYRSGNFSVYEVSSR